MADSVVTFLLENLSQLLQQQSKLLHGVKDQIKSLQNELRMINVFLKNTEGKRNENELVKEVDNQIRDVANEAEDVIDTFIVNAIRQRERSMLGKFIHSYDYASVLRGVANKIQSIKNVIKEIYDNREKYGIEITESAGDAEAEAEESLHRRRRLVEEDDVVGFVHDSEALVKQLIQGGLQQNVLSIIGMGGLGKTTLAKKIYNNNQVKNHFKYRGWVYVSQEYRTRELLLEILSSVLKVKKNATKAKLEDLQDLNDEDLKRMLEEKYKAKTQLEDLDDEDLKKMLFKSLQGMRYLMVMDDVWKPQLWDEVRAAFPDELKGSRILITSRLKEVASHASTTPPYFLPFLDKKESWELFTKKVFRGEIRCPPQLETLGRQIAESCDGLPLSLVVLGGLLANKEKTQRTWSKLIGHVNSYLTQDKTQCLDILALSYNHLTQRLKPCFLYVGVYPEDFEIPVRRLIELWIAEGFIQQIGSRNLVDIAEDYLEELIDRSLIQVASTRTDGGVKTCRVHDLLRDLCISKSLNDKFLEVHRDVNHSSNKSKPRRLSILYGVSQYISSSSCDPSSVRSFLCFGQDVGCLATGRQLIQLYKSVKLVRVLDLGLVKLHSIPNQIGKLIHLRLLRIRSAYLKVIPESICSLWNLETLDTRGSPVKYLPRGIWKLQRLRHLYLSKLPGLPDPPRTDGKPFWNLQVISTVALDQQTDSLMAKAQFPNVIKLGLYQKRYIKQDSHLQYVLENLYNLQQLQKLKIIGTSKLPRSPNSIPLTLTKITLADFSTLDSDCMTILGNLPYLQILKLCSYTIIPYELNCIAGGFPQLQVLKMEELAVSKWNLPKDAMPCLQCVVIKDCELLGMLPDELWCLAGLKDVEVSHPNPELEMMLKKMKVKDGCKLQVYP